VKAALRRQTVPYRANGPRRAPESPVLGQPLPLRQLRRAWRRRRSLALFLWGLCAGLLLSWVLVELTR
jgi:hypothetical protein